MTMTYQWYGVQPQNVTGSMTRSGWSNVTGEHSVQKPTVGPYNLGGWGPMSYPREWLQNYWMQMNQQMTPGRMRPERGFTQGGMLGIAGGMGGQRWQAGGVTQNAFAMPTGGAGGMSAQQRAQPFKTPSPIPGNTGVPPSNGLASPDNDKGGPTLLYNAQQPNVPQINGGGAAGMGWYPKGTAPRSGGGQPFTNPARPARMRGF